MSILIYFLQDNVKLKGRNIVEEVYDENIPWDYFHAASREEERICGAREIIFLPNYKWFSFKAGLGQGMNNFSEISALRLLLFLDLERGINDLQIFGDSQVIVK